MVSFGKSIKSNIRLVSVRKENDFNLVSINVEGEKFKFKIKNINIQNVLASFAVLLNLNIDFKNRLSIFQKLQPSEGRGLIHKIKDIEKKFNLIDESYNSNPLSVKNAIKNFTEIKKIKAKKYLLLGDMLELGKNQKNIIVIFQDLLTDQILIKFL